MAGIRRASDAAIDGVRAAAAMLREAAIEASSGLRRRHADLGGGPRAHPRGVRPGRLARTCGHHGQADGSRTADRPRAGSGPLPCRTRRSDRPVAPRRGVGLLVGHDAHLRARRGQRPIAELYRSCSMPTSSLCAAVGAGGPAPVRDRLRCVRGGRVSDGPHQGSPARRCARASTSGSAMASGSRSTRRPCLGRAGATR